MKPSLLLLPLLALACGPASPTKTPTHDVTPPTTNTGDGEVMGADRVAPGQKLEQGPQLDSREGLKAAPKPGEE
jgi:hypothetical protein